jgi:multicomponent Na+:H+ antiporter subunit B
MNSVILATVSRLVTALLLILSLFLLIRGHNLPGGGFAGGLVAAGAFVLELLARGSTSARKLLGVDPSILIGIGLAVAVLSGLPGMVEGMPFLTGVWDKTVWPVLGKLGTPLLFDTGVYITVLGISCLIVFSLWEEED